MVELPCRVFRASDALKGDGLLAREWIVTNGLGGYASGTVGGVNTWRYHGLLVSAENAPLGRMMSLSQLFEKITFADGKKVYLGGEERPAGELDMASAEYLTEFRLEAGLPVWRYCIDGLEFERAIVMPHRQNTVYITYKILRADGAVRFELKPCIWFRPFEATYDQVPHHHIYRLSMSGRRYEISAGDGLPVLRLQLYADHAQFQTDGGARREVFFRKDAQRGCDPRGVLWTPGYFAVDLAAGQEIALVASTEPWVNIQALDPAEAVRLEHERRERLLYVEAPENVRTGLPAELVLAADQFIIQPAGRFRERIRALATGESVRAVIAGYHWFTDWGRDTLIGLEGLTLVTGRADNARAILTALNRYVKDGLLPNLFPEGAEDGLYHTADATLWYFHAIDRYLEYTEDRQIMKTLLPTLVSIAEHHLMGTRFGICVDPKDGLLVQSEEGYQLTWMDAKVDGWVVTPRRGKAVEINALWHNAICLLAGWLDEEGDAEAAGLWRTRAAKLRESFNQRFWYGDGGYLYDVIDGEGGHDSACRPNQLLAFSLRFPILDESRWEQVLKVAKERLLTPLGLRSLAPGHPDYKPQYFGDLRARDAAYHQGTVWPWLIGPFIDAWLKVYPDDKTGARQFLEGFAAHLDEAGVGTISEICDAEAPYHPRGCISQAWSVAEVLRCWVKTK